MFMSLCYVTNKHKRMRVSMGLQMGELDEKKSYLLYPNYKEYFNTIFLQFQKGDYHSFELGSIAEVVQKLLFDVQSSRIMYFQEFEAAFRKIQQIYPLPWEEFTSMVPLLQDQAVKTLKESKSVEINSSLYGSFPGLSLGRYLKGLCVEMMVVLTLTRMRLLDGNMDKLSRLEIPSMETLTLSENEITVEGVKMLVRYNKWSLLRKLNLSRNSLNNEALRQLSNSSWKYLRSLELEGNPFGDMGVDYLCKYSPWVHLQHLDLRTRRNLVTTLFQSTSEQNWHCQLTRRSVQSLLQRDWKLSSLLIFIGSREVSANGYSKMKEALIGAL